MHSDITALLQEARGGDAVALCRLTDAVYEQLREIAGAQMRRERAGHTLQPTALVNEAYLRLFRHEQAGWRNRSHFFAIAASQMRRILVEHGRMHNAAKRKGLHLELREGDAVQAAGVFEPSEVETLLRKLHDKDPAAARVVELKIFAGFTDDEVVQLTGQTKAKVRADWSFAKSWLGTRLRGDRNFHNAEDS